jgi:phosphoglycerol transferase MdoB-like AlkP superfamily enzyme
MYFYLCSNFIIQFNLIFNTFKKLPAPFRLILNFYVLSLGIFFVFRLILFLLELKHIESIPADERLGIVVQSFFMGLRFDVVITGYIIFLPAFLLLLFYQLNLQNKLFPQLIKVYLIVLFSVSFLICGIDLTYFHHFFSRFSVAGFQWADNTEFMVGMIVQEFDYWWVIFPIIISIYLYIKLLNQWAFNPLKVQEKTTFTTKKRILSIFFSLLTLALIFLGIRGRLESKSPIRVGTAYFSNYAFANQLGLNPVFTLLRSYLDAKKEKTDRVNLMDAELAIKNTQTYLNREGNEFSPIAENVVVDSINNNPPNIVLVIMESMSAAKMGRFGNADNLTPFLDSIANQGYSFDNIYSAGTHTFNGIYSTLFSFPALFTKHPMKGVEIPKYHGMGSVLKQLGYTTTYFTTHDDQFDNVGGFLRGNDYEQVISEQDYPAEKVESTLGVPDDYLFEFAIPKLNELHQKNKPFFVAMMTASDHGPYVVPNYFTPKQTDVKKQIVEYADWSIQKFIELARKQTWFNNTLFVFIADHGAFMDAKYDVPLSYNHVPFIIYAPKLLPTSKKLDHFGGQIDVFPTVMNLVALPYTNNTLGVDLFTHQRPYAYFCNDDKLAVINQEYLFVYRKNSESSLYKYRETSLTDYIKQLPTLADSMKTYGLSQVQAAQHLIENKKLTLEK